MGQGAAKELVPMVPMLLNALPPLIDGFRNTRSDDDNREDRMIEKVLQRLEREREEGANEILQNQAQLNRTYEALNTLMNRMEDGEMRPQVTDGRTGAHGQGRIRIEMDLPDNAEEREEAIQNFWRTLARLGSAYSERERNLPFEDRTEFREGSNRSRLLHLTSSSPSSVDDEVACGTSASSTSSKYEQHLSCEICTQRYNNQKRRPTLLTQCGHTFCLECLEKSRARNNRCPTCRKPTDTPVHQLPTNYSILDFLNKDEDDDDDCKKVKSKTLKPMLSPSGLTEDEEVELAICMSMENDVNQVKKDFLLAQRLQEEEERIMRFRQHEDTVCKGRARNESGSDEDLCLNDNRRRRRRNSWEYNDRDRYDNEQKHKIVSDDDDDDDCRQLPVRNNSFAEAHDDDYRRQPVRNNSFVEDHTDDYCRRPVRNNSFAEAHDDDYRRRPMRNNSFAEAHDDDYRRQPVRNNSFAEAHDDNYRRRPVRNNSFAETHDEDCHQLPVRNNSYAEAREAMDGISKMIDDDSDDCQSTRGNQPSEAAWGHVVGERMDDSNTQPQLSFYDSEKAQMLRRAEERNQEEKKMRKQKKLMKEQEDVETAIALSLSMVDMHSGQSICVASK